MTGKSGQCCEHRAYKLQVLSDLTSVQGVNTDNVFLRRIRARHDSGSLHAPTMSCVTASQPAYFPPGISGMYHPSAVSSQPHQHQQYHQYPQQLAHHQYHPAYSYLASAGASYTQNSPTNSAGQVPSPGSSAETSSSVATPGSPRYSHQQQSQQAAVEERIVNQGPRQFNDQMGTQSMILGISHSKVTKALIQIQIYYMSTFSWLYAFA